ncbi:CBS domain-containing protein [Candidatus Micrarchaeota archaeon]|nr:CBS domain-containing protein [Candidatus Micrarchaeota archaeon]
MALVKVGDVMHRGVLVCHKGTSIREVANVMRRTGIGGMPVVNEKHKLTGIITEGDIISKVVAAGKDPAKTTVSGVMSRPVRTISPEADVTEAARLMRDLNVSRIPVVTRRGLIGIITQTDIVHAEPALVDLAREREMLERVPSSEKLMLLSGECEECGNYSESLRYSQGALKCEDCY